MRNWRVKQERRRWRRHWLKAPVRIISDAGMIDGFGLRVSEGGMYLFAVADFEVGARLDVEFKHPHSGQPSRCSGLVRNRVVYLYGLEFVHEQEQETPHRFAPNATVNS
ncbi:MAG TPA: PilZ domain-containing protein [Terriglobales bacterium]|jgi:hypothetical protein|nr:PilZ domain-containing protein [Terriglobales bacterium]